eukprot:SAG11_NODE_6660_length_1271_cov_2.051195_1_plen_32_part_10
MCRSEPQHVQEGATACAGGSHSMCRSEPQHVQ